MSGFSFSERGSTNLQFHSDAPLGDFGPPPRPAFIVFFPKTPTGPQGGRAGATAGEHPCPAGVSGRHGAPCERAAAGIARRSVERQRRRPDRSASRSLFFPRSRRDAACFSCSLSFSLARRGEFGFDRCKLRSLQTELGGESEGLPDPRAIGVEAFARVGEPMPAGLLLALEVRARVPAERWRRAASPSREARFRTPRLCAEARSCSGSRHARDAGQRSQGRNRRSRR